MAYGYRYREDTDRNSPLDKNDFRFMGTNLTQSYRKLSPEQIIDEGRKVLAADRRRFSGMSKPQYKGRTTTPMSSLTQRSRNLQQQFAQKPAPYNKKIASVLNRPRVGIPEQRLQNQVQGLASRQSDFNQTGILDSLREQFGESYAPRKERFMRKGQKDIMREAERAAGVFGDIRTTSENLENSSNEQLIKALKAQQSQKVNRRNALTGMLDKFGNQKHAHTNLVNQTARNEFEEEASSPYKRMDMLDKTIRNLGRDTQIGVHPDIKDQSGLDMLQALKAYGIDIDSPISQWQGRDKPLYFRNRVENLSPEIEKSHKFLEAINPKYRDAFYDSRKNLTKQLMENQSLGGQAMEAVPERMRGEVDSLESEARKKLKKDLSSISQSFIQANQYNSPQHIKAAENRAREIAASTFGERNKLLQDSMKSELDSVHKRQLSKFSQLGIEGEQGKKEYYDMLKTIEDMNSLGSTKWKNEQSENEDLYKNYKGANSWDWPHMQGRTTGRDAGDNISLDELNATYSESEKEPMRNDPPVNNAEDFKKYPSTDADTRIKELMEERDRAYEDKINAANRFSHYYSDASTGKTDESYYTDYYPTLGKKLDKYAELEHELKYLRRKHISGSSPEELEQLTKNYKASREKELENRDLWVKDGLEKLRAKRQLAKENEELIRKTREAFLSQKARY